MDAVNRPVDVSRLLDQRRMSPVQWLVVCACGLALFMDGYDIQVMALAVPSVAHEWSADPSRFGLALSAALIGLGLGAALLAPLGDRFGRRTLVMTSLVIAGAATLATATADSAQQFVLWRLLTGIGLGAGIPNCNAWTSEYAPARSRAKLLVLMNAAVGIGAFCAGLIAPGVLASWGWRGTFVIGGCVPLLLAAFIFFSAPESLKFLLSRRPRDPRIRATLERLAPELHNRPLALPEVPTELPRASLAELVGPVYRRRTLVLWAVVFVNLFTLYFLISWLPILLQSAGWPLDAAIRGAVLIQAGGVIGGIVLAFFLDRGHTLPALLTAFVLAAGALALFPLAPSGVSWIAMLCVIGAGINGSQLALNALSTAYYPPAIKATGMSWIGAIGTVGSIIAPLAGGWIIGQGIAAVNILAIMSLPAALCAAGVLLMRREWQMG